MNFIFREAEDSSAQGRERAGMEIRQRPAHSRKASAWLLGGSPGSGYLLRFLLLTQGMASPHSLSHCITGSHCGWLIFLNT